MEQDDQQRQLDEFSDESKKRHRQLTSCTWVKDINLEVKISQDFDQDNKGRNIPR